MMAAFLVNNFFVARVWYFPETPAWGIFPTRFPGKILFTYETKRASKVGRYSKRTEIGTAI